MLIYICCVLDCNIHIFDITQRDGPYQRNKKKILFLSVSRTVLLLCTCAQMYKYPLARQSLETYEVGLSHFSYLYVEFETEKTIGHAIQVVISFTTCQGKVLKTHCVSNVHFELRGF